MKQLLGIELTDKEYDFLLCEQAKGKNLKIVDGKIIVVEHKETDFEKAQKQLSELYAWFEEYDNQVKQYQRCQRLGIEFDKDINELDNQAKIKAEIITELRKITGGENGN